MRINWIAVVALAAASAQDKIPANSDESKVRSYTLPDPLLLENGEQLRDAAVRLKNGNTLIIGNQHGYVRELNPKGEVVWEINKNDLPGIELYTVQDADRLANGNRVINNWPGSLKLEEWPGVVQVIEVTPDNKVVWALRDWSTLGPASSRQLLDENGKPEDREIAEVILK